MLACEELFGEDIGRRIQGFVEGAVGGPCPCKQGLGCPMVPTGRTEMSEPVVRVASDAA
jgi:hypothetical protein